MVNIIEFFIKVAESPKKSAELGGGTGFFIGVLSWWEHFTSSIWGTFIIGIASTIIFAIAGAAASFFTNRYLKKKFEK